MKDQNCPEIIFFWKKIIGKEKSYPPQCMIKNISDYYDILYQLINQLAMLR